MQDVTAAAARSTIAHLVLGDAGTNPTLGSVALHAHQRDALGVLRRQLDESRGVLLADDVGLGKTFTALALAQGERTTVLAPAGLRATWWDSARRADARITFVSFESLSRGVIPATGASFIIVDEAHHLRNRRTIRFTNAAQLCCDARVVLLSATPVQNAEQDLRVLLSLFLGERAYAMPAAELARHIVRRTAADLGASSPALPTTGEPQWLDRVEDGDCLDRILGLPAAVPVRDGGDAGMLAAYSLARQWASSRSALEAALRRRIARGLALADALRTGRHPSRSELAAWTHAGDAQQLAFPELVVDASGGVADPSLLAAVDAHLAGVRELLAWLPCTPDPDEARAARLAQVLARHPGERVVAFSEFAETVTALYARLARHGRVAMLTHTGGRVAGGPLSRAEVLARFAPGASAPDAERIDLLLATDVLSEGVGLHDASVAVHLDLAWNPARLAQRVGRLRRFGASRSRVHVYVMPPPADSDRLLRIEERLESKVARAGRIVGVAGEILPRAPVRHRSVAEREQRVAAMLARWRDCPPAGAPIAAAVSGDATGALVCARDGERVRLLWWNGERVTDDMQRVEEALPRLERPGVAVPRPLLNRAVALAHQWLEHHRLGTVVDLSALRLARSRRSLLHRADGIARRTPRHARPRVAPLVHAVRAAATATLSAGAERVLDELARASLPDEAWLQAVGQFAELHARPVAHAPRIEVVLLVVPPERA